MDSLDHDDRDEVVAQWRAAADLVAQQPELAPLAERLRAWLAAGATRRAAAELIPPAPRGGSHGRGDALRMAIAVLRKLRRQHFGHCSNRQAAEYLRRAVLEYQAGAFRKNREAGIFPVSDLEYWAHRFLLSGALHRAGKLIEAETIARYLGDENSDQMNFNSALKFK